MNVSGIFAILDDVAATLDDVAVMSKVAAKKTAGILGDDLAVNAQMSSNFASDRELPVLWAIAKGSLVNKLIILPVAFLLSAFAPWMIVPILIAGALYLSYEGAEKIAEYFHSLLHKDSPKEPHGGVEDVSEQEKIKKAITTDFILSVEIVVLALGTVSKEPLLTQIIVTSFIALLATVGVYGLVALLVRMDDFGIHLVNKAQTSGNKQMEKTGLLLISSMPKMIKALTVIGVVAMLLVAGGIMTHNVEALHHIGFLNNMLGEIFIGGVLGFGVIALLKLKEIVKPKNG
jgi:predicted DNA repair protein MutK